VAVLGLTLSVARTVRLAVTVFVFTTSPEAPGPEVDADHR
jgi:hypothetical protein